jgi:calcineurin-like phosphoesterase family protein
LIWFTSDLHLDHKNIIQYSKRPFSDVNEMNNAIIANINITVHPEDTLYIVGDFAFANIDRTNELLDMIKCKDKRLVDGNHDKFLRDNSGKTLNCTWHKSYYEFDISGFRFILFHYPIAVWNVKHYGSIHIYGHVHNESIDVGPPPQYMKNAFNVNCEMHNYFPVSADLIINKWFDPQANLIHGGIRI